MEGLTKIEELEDLVSHLRVDLVHAHQQSTELMGKLAENKSVWRPIETAPKDGTRILLWNKPEADVGYWSTSVWVSPGAWIIYEDRSDTVEITPTHWMPIPPIDSCDATSNTRDNRIKELEASCALLSANAGQPLVDRLQALESGLVEAVKALEGITKVCCGESQMLTEARCALTTLKPLISEVKA